MLCEIENPRLMDFKHFFDNGLLVFMGLSIEANVIESTVESNYLFAIFKFQY